MRVYVLVYFGSSLVLCNAGRIFGGVLRCLLLFMQHFKSALRMWIQDIMEVFVSTTKSALWLRLNLNISMT